MGRLSQRKQVVEHLQSTFRISCMTGVRRDDSASFDATLPQLQANTRSVAIPH